MRALLFVAAAATALAPPPAKRALLDLCRPSRYGVVPVDEARLRALVAELEEANPTARPAESPLFSGNWELLWTTETELLFAVEKGLFGAGLCLGVNQVIDMAAGTLENIVEFDNDSRLVVGSTIAPAAGDGSRFDFSFNTCALVWRGFSLPLPPIGKGWGDLLYLDENLRVQSDIRGDLLIATKVKG